MRLFRRRNGPLLVVAINFAVIAAGCADSDVEPDPATSVTATWYRNYHRTCRDHRTAPMLPLNVAGARLHHAARVSVLIGLGVPLTGKRRWTCVG